MRIGEAAKRSGMASKTIRFYEEAGLVEPAARTQSGYREFSDEDVLRLRFIHRARDLGFSVREAHRLLSLWSDRGARKRGREATRAGARRTDRGEDDRAAFDARRHFAPRRALPW